MDGLPVGASLVLATVRVKVVLALRLPLSVAVTRTSRLPTSICAGVPLKVRVPTSKISQSGNASPLARLAL
ncbi:hypothetical protein D3C78_1967500 [compost metagenome]